MHFVIQASIFVIFLNPFKCEETPRHSSNATVSQSCDGVLVYESFNSSGKCDEILDGMLVFSPAKVNLDNVKYITKRSGGPLITIVGDPNYVSFRFSKDVILRIPPKATLFKFFQKKNESRYKIPRYYKQYFPVSKLCRSLLFSTQANPMKIFYFNLRYYTDIPINITLGGFILHSILVIFRTCQLQWNFRKSRDMMMYKQNVEKIEKENKHNGGEAATPLSPAVLSPLMSPMLSPENGDKTTAVKKMKLPGSTA